MKTWGILLLFITGFFASVQLTLAAPIVAGSFSTTWKTDNPGTTATNQIRIPTTGTGYNYNIYWEDVASSTINGTLTGRTGATTITFPAIGTYRVDITGSFPRIYFNNGGDRQKILTVEQWGNITWMSMASAFSGASNLQVLAIDAPDLASASSTSSMFSGATTLNNDISHWDVSTITNMSSMFSGATAFNQSLNAWDVSSVVTIFSLFQGAASFNQPLDLWNLASATSLDSLFSGATSFNQPLESWDMSNKIAISRMFSGATAFNQPLNAWDVSNITSIGMMFRNATAFNQPLDQWDVTNVEWSGQMFEGATAFNQSLNGWTTNSLTESQYMFAYATAFNQPLDNWDMTNVFDMESMFEGATSFNQDLSGWNVIGPDLYGFGIFENIFLDSALDITNYSRILTSWSGLSVAAGQNLGTVGPSSGPTPYCSTAQAARDILVTTYSWIITDGGSAPCYIATYTPGLNATLIGQGTQTVVDGEDSTEVEVVPDAGYRFVKWSDESTQNPRTDLAVGANLTVSAIIEADPSGGSSGTRVGVREQNMQAPTTMPITTTTSTPAVTTTDSLLNSVAALIDRMRGNEQELKNLPPEEKQKLIALLQAVVVQLLALLASL